LKLTRHNGRSGKHGTYNPRHNDRRFDVENSEHISLTHGCLRAMGGSVAGNERFPATNCPTTKVDLWS